MSNWREFRPQHNLLQPNFDGYRLSLDPLAQYSLKFDDHISVQKEFDLNNNFYTLNTIKAFKSLNELYINPWKDEHHLYFVDQTHAIQCIDVSSNESLSRLQQPMMMYQLPRNSLHGSMFFLTESLVLLSDGRSKLFLVRIEQNKWKLVHEEDLDEYVTSPFRLLHAVLHESNFHAMLGFLNDDCQLLWTTFSLSSSNECRLTRRRVSKGKKWPDFIAIETNGQGLYVAAEQMFTFTFDSVIEVKPEEPNKQSSLEMIESSLRYTWLQTQSSIEIEIDPPQDGNSHQWSVNIESNTLKCSFDGNILIDANLCNPINPKESSYLITTDKARQLTITLVKSDPSLFWNEVFKEGRAIAGEIKMVNLPEVNNTDTDDEIKQPYNSQQLEDCDQYTNDDDMYLSRFDGDTHRITHQALIYNQILFTKTNPPSLCIRHDVDGLIWQMNSITSDDTSPWTHEATLNAFGYVQASKQNRKFMSTPSDHSYALIADLQTHLYLYKQHSPASSSSGASLRNRKTGKLVESIAKQYLISLENHDEILGLITATDRIYILTAKNLFVVTL